MFNRIYRLVDIGRFSCFQRELILDENSVIVKPLFLSICQADQRYFKGQRNLEIIRKKLPMALIHEGMLEVVYDKKGEYKKGDKVVLVPNHSFNNSSKIKKNYHEDATFLSSNSDGLTQDLVKAKRESLVRIEKEIDDNSIYALTELVSVAYNAYNIFIEKVNKEDIKSVGIWGDGAVSFCMALILKYELPDVKINVIGKHSNKLMFFSFADAVYEINDIPENLKFDHCFECVGGVGSEDAINQIIEFVKPQGIISLLGVSEYGVSINTRDVLGKGLTLVGHSRSEKEDFEKSVKLIQNDKYTRMYLKQIITKEIEVVSIKSLIEAFEVDTLNPFKTILKWNV